MKLPISIRSIEPRTWKAQKSGREGHQVEGLALEIGPDMTIAATIPFKVEAESRQEAERLTAAFVGKNAVLVVKKLDTTMDGEPLLVGVLEAGSSAK